MSEKEEDEFNFVDLDLECDSSNDYSISSDELTFNLRNTDTDTENLETSKGQFTPGTKSVRYIWDVKRNIYVLFIHFGEMFINN